MSLMVQQEEGGGVFILHSRERTEEEEEGGGTPYALRWFIQYHKIPSHVLRFGVFRVQNFLQCFSPFDIAFAFSLFGVPQTFCFIRHNKNK